MSLTLDLGGYIPGTSLAIAVEEAMKMMDGPQYRKPTGWNRLRATTGRYIGDAILHPGAWCPVTLVPEPDEKALPHHGRVAIYAEDRRGRVILEVARLNEAYKKELDRVNGIGNILPPLLAPVQAGIMMLFNRLDPNHPEKYAKVTYEDNIFVEIEPQRAQSRLEFHVNALNPEYGGGVVKSMHDVHFDGIRDNFLHLCREICRELVIPIEDTLDSLHSTSY